MYRVIITTRHGGRSIWNRADEVDIDRHGWICIEQNKTEIWIPRGEVVRLSITKMEDDDE